ncbi:conserved oligomeric Golgi complex subunit 2-like isoform X2 [Babylonia areolata]|uniref:conserved oligomeric Golgi complex subunit 2-like isoform X2 n=1 Tax=Babylonia areolata TaxID=304850 RepID=UPI003FD10871
MTVDVGKGFALPSGPSSLCFDKEEFMKKDFDVDGFVITCRKRVPLETLRDDLSVYLKILKSAMIELINKDYADFVNLSTNLVGMDKAISNLTVPLGQLREEVLSVRTAMNEAMKAVEEKLRQQQEIQKKKACLQRLLNITHSVEKIEQLLGISHSASSSTASVSNTSSAGQLSGQLIERVATEFNKLQFYVTKSKGLPLVEKIKPRIANITTTLQYSLEGSFLEGLEQEDVGMLRQCLRTYALIDKIRDAESLFRQHVVKPYMEEVISETFLRSSQQGLEGMFNKVLDFVPTHCHVLRNITCPGTSSGEMVRGYDFLVNAVWPEIVANLEARTPSIFAPGNPEVFHQKYLISQRFVKKFETLCATQASVQRLRNHPSYHTFTTKWSLPVYFQIRFQDIAGALETALVTGLNSPSGGEWKLHATDTLWAGLQRCWTEEVYLPALLHRFWKLSLQQMARHASWLDQLYDDEMERRRQSLSSKPSRGSLPTSASTSQLMSLGDGGRSGSPTPRSASPQPQGQQDGGAGGSLCEPITTGQIVCLLCDASRLQDKIPEMYETFIRPKVLASGLQSDDALKECIQENASALQERLPKFRSMVTDEIVVQCSAFIRQVSDIPRLYRRTNREAPSKPSGYLTGMVRPLRLFSDEHAADLGTSQLAEIMMIVFSSLIDQFCEVTGEVLTSVKKMEESLKRLKKVRGSDKASSNQGMSDDDKIRSQIIIDIEELGKQMELFGIEKDTVSRFSRLHTLAEEAKSDMTTV